ncbi:MAG: CHAT domain-containing protein, partial [Anaerolineae bacterium]|nr:CHAT domain-containing protein [Anaerolineae bacterium]
DLSPAQRNELQAILMAHGPKIAAADGLGTVTAAVQLLDALWASRDLLPAAAVQVLAAGQMAPVVGLRRPIAIASAEKRRLLLEKMIELADFRVYEDPSGTADALVALVQSGEDRLTPEEQRTWRRLRDAFARGGDPEAFLRRAEALLGAYPAVRTLLAGRKVFVRPIRPLLREAEIARPSASPPPPPDFEAYMSPTRPLSAHYADSPAPQPVYAMMESAATEAELTRFANVYFPATVLITQQDIPLVIHVAQRYAAKSVLAADAARMTLKVGDLTIVVQAEDFVVTEAMGGMPAAGEAPGRIVKVEAERDCEPVVFLLTPRAVGDKRITIFMDQFGRNLLTQSFQVKVVADLSAVNDLANVKCDPVPVVSPARGEAAPPPDLELRVLLSADRRRLSFLLHGGGEYHYKPAGEVTLTADSPRAFVQPMLDRLSTLAGRGAAERTAGETDAIKQELTALGNYLFEHLFPAELKEEYGKTIRTKFAGKSLLITSDEPWIPWEIVRPFAVDRDGNVLYDDPPLCEMFRLSRWLAGPGTPDQVRLKQGAWVAPPGGAPAAEAESRYFQELHRRQWQVSLEGPLTRVADVQARLQAKSVQLLHFACHGNFDASNPDNSMVKLEGGYFSPAQLDARMRAGLAAAKPLVFLNACHSGEIGFALTGLGGWASTLIGWGASAFIGSLWEINGKLAAQFAREFYDRLWGVNAFEGKPQPLGQAFHEARLAIKAVDEANPTWLAYVLYGDPYGQVVLGATE